jgi:hypothetical protein
MRKNQIILIILLMINTVSVVAETIHVGYQIKRRDSASLTISVSLMPDKNGHAQVRIPNSGTIIALSKGTTAAATGREGEFQLSAATGKQIMISYILTNGEGPSTHAYYSRPVIMPDYFYFSGNDGLATPMISDSVKVEVALVFVGFTKSDFLGSSYFIANKKGDFTTTLAYLKKGIFCGGNFRVRQFDAAGKKVVLALAGKIQTTDDKAFSSVTDQLRKEMNKDAHDGLPFYFSIMIPYRHKTDLSKSAGLVHSSLTLMEGRESAIVLLE